MGSELEKKRKLVIHFDVNNTILVADPVSNIDTKQAVNTYLAGAYWGKEVNGMWEFSSMSKEGKLTLACPEDAEESSYKYLERTMQGEGVSREKFKEAIGRFSSEERGQIAAEWCDKIIASLTAPTDLKDTPFAFEHDGIWYHYIIPSFWKLLASLSDEGRDFAIVVRTYGTDGPEIAKAIAAFAQGKHPEYPDGCPAVLPVDPASGSLKRSDDGIQLVFDQANSSTLHDEVQIYKYLTALKGTFTCRDDYHFWAGKKFAALSGKPLWFPKTLAERKSSEAQHIFFDDNFRVSSPENSILDARVVESVGNEWESKGSCDPGLAAIAGCMVQAALHESTTNLEYFTEQVRSCEKLWEQEG